MYPTWNALPRERCAVRERSRRSSVASKLTLSGGVGGAVLLALAALCSWALASPGAVDPGSAFRTLQFLPFLMGRLFVLFLAGVARTVPGKLLEIFKELTPPLLPCVHA